MVHISIKNRMVIGSVDRYMVASRSRNVRGVGEAGLVKAFGSLNNLVKATCYLWRRDTPPEDVARGNRRAVEITIRVLALNKHCALERHTSEQSYQSFKLVSVEYGKTPHE
jgi:hypothetical protein